MTGPFRRRSLLSRSAGRRVAAAISAALAFGLLVAVPAPAGAADTAYTFTEQKFDGASFPGAGWSTTGDWSQQCTPAPPGGGCSAVASTTSTGYTQSDLTFKPSTVLPSNLQDATLSFTEAANLDGQPDYLRLWATPAGANQGGDLRFLFDASNPNSDGSGAPSTPTTYTVPLTQPLTFPLIFRWQSWGDAAGSPARSWAISDVKISGTLPATDYALAADPIPNNAYPFVTAGKPTTFTLSGSSDPVGDSLNFAITSPPSIGTFGPVTAVDSTHAKVTYTAGATDCPDPAGTAGFLCTVTFKYTASDAQGHVSPPATGAIDLHPGGSGGAAVTVSAPPSTSYSTIVQGNTPIQAGNLSGVVQVGPSGYPDAVEVHLRASTGTIHLPNAGTSGVTFVNGTADNEQQVQFRGPIAKVNAALGLFLYLPPDGTTPDATVDIYAADLGATGQSGFLNPVHQAITIKALTNTPRPVLTLPTGPLSIATSNGPLTFPAGAATGISLTDGGASDSTNDTVRLGVSDGKLALPTGDTSGPAPLVSVSTDGGMFSITGTVAHLSTALTHLSYDPSGVGATSVSLSGFVFNPDSGLTSPSATTSITVVQGPSLYGATAVGTLQNVALPVFLCGRGPDGAQLSYSVSTGPSHGTFTPDPAASATTSGCSVNPGTLVSGYTYTPADGFLGTDRISYRITDATTGLSAAGSLDITVSAHRTPTAEDASASTRQDSPVDVTVCALNPDPQPAPLTFEITAQPSQGTVRAKGIAPVSPCADPNQTAYIYTYTPAAGAFTSDGTDSFSYRVSNGVVSPIATVRLTVASRTPQIAIQPLSVNENGSLGFLVCVTAPNGALTYSIGDPAHGTLDSGSPTTNGPSCPIGFFGGTYRRYVPTPYFSGIDLVSVRVSDGSYSSPTVELPIVVHFVEIPPSAAAKSLTVLSGRGTALTLSGNSVHGLPLTYRVVSPPSHGTLTGTAPNLTYTPSIGNGTDSFSYVANDGTADGAPAQIQLRVTTPSLSSAVCRPGTTELHPDQFACIGTLPTGPDGTPLAATDGTRGSMLRLQEQVTNSSAVADDVTVTGSPGSSGTSGAGTWDVRYAVAGNDDTDAVLGAGLTVQLEPGASTYVQLDVFAPRGFEGASSFPVTVRTVSGNDTSVSSTQTVRVTDGASRPTLTASQADGTGAASWPLSLYLSPYLYVGGPAGSAKLQPSISGTGHNSFTVRAEVQSSTSDAAVSIRRGSQDVTAAVLAGTFSLECYSDIGCLPLTVTFTPGRTAGSADVRFVMTSKLDGQLAYAEVATAVAATVGPDLYTTPPRTGYGLIETTPSTQIVSAPVLAGHSATQRVILRSAGTLSDTFSLRAAVTGTAAVSITATAPTSNGDGTPVDVTAAVRAGTYRVQLASFEEVLVYVTVRAGSATGADAADVVLTAASQLAPDHTDTYAVQFPSYSYRPDITLTGPDGGAIGSGVYSSGDGANQAGFYPTSLSARTIRMSFDDHGTGPQPTADSLLIKAPASTSDFDLSYRLQLGSELTDVTRQVTGDGLTVSLGRGQPTLLMSASSSYTARAGRPGYFTVSATSVAAGLSDAVQVQLFTEGASQLRFGGLPQPEPADVARNVQNYGLKRTAPFPSAGYAPGVYYGAYPDPAGGKFVYDSTYDSFDLQIYSDNVTATRQALRFSAPATSSSAMPYWERMVFGQEYYNQGQPMLPADPLGPDGVHPKITVNGVDVSAAVLAGTWSTDQLRSGGTLNVHVSFAPADGDSQRYLPLQIALVDPSSGAVEDQLHLGLSSIITCDPTVALQQHLTDGHNTLNVRSYDRSNYGNDCMQKLTSTLVTKRPLVFGSNDGDTAEPRGLWLVPQGGSVLTVGLRTLEITGSAAKAYVDTALLGPDGNPDSSTYRSYNYLGSYPNLDWLTADRTNGLAVAAQSALAPSPFPMVAPSPDYYPNNTMSAGRYFQFQPSTGAPAMIGTMRVNEPWFHGDVNLSLPVDSATGLVLDYAAPADLKASLPGDNSTTTDGFFWTTRSDGTVTQGGCLGLPPRFFNLIGINSSYCLIGVTTTFKPIPSDPSIEARIADITFNLKVVGVEIGTPEFNLKSLDGHIELDPVSGDVTKVVANASFGIGPVTPCYAEQKARSAAVPVAAEQKVLDKLCPKNFFVFNAQVTFQEGGFTSANSTTGYGIKFVGSLSFLGLIQLNSVEADISTAPFNFHFADSPIDLTVNAGIPISAKITLAGDVGALGFDIGISGSISVLNQSIASASGIVSTKGMGICGGLLGVSVGFGQAWGSSPTFYGSGCTTNQYRVTS